MFSFKVVVAMIGNATVVPSPVSSSNSQTHSECEDKCSSAILRLNTGSLRSILPCALYILNSCQDAALESVCLQLLLLSCHTLLQHQS
jgi:hypothetical protein